MILSLSKIIDNLTNGKPMKLQIFCTEILIVYVGKLKVTVK